MSKIHRVGAILTAALLALSACASDSGSSSGNDPGTKTGGNPAPITITVADSQPQGKPSNVPLAEFARQVASLSEGSMQVKVVTEASIDAPIPDSDVPVIESVKSGEFEMAVIPARAWSSAGVSSLRPLQAPFLVQSDEQMNAVVNDDAIVSSLFAGLEPIGVHGLRMFPESLRHFFSFTTPILTPDDVKGRQIRYVSSTDVATLITTLGATPVDPPGDEFGAGVENGTITAGDSGFTIAMGSNIRPATATGNLVLYAKVITLVVNNAFWGGLSETQRDSLSKAAEATQGWAISNRVPERQAAAKYCTDGGTVVLTDPQSLTAFRAAVAPIYADLERDTTTKQTITAIDALATPSPAAAAVAACAAPTAPTEVVARGGELPNGIYRVEYTQAYLTGLGMSARDAENNYGVWTFRLEDGRWSFERVAATNCCTSGDRQAGLYQVDGDGLVWAWQNTNEGSVDLTWSVDVDGSLHFAEVHPGSTPDYVFGLPWPRIGSL